MGPGHVRAWAKATISRLAAVTLGAAVVLGAAEALVRFLPLETAVFLDILYRG